MKTISTGNIFRIYDDTLKTYNCLPSQVYSVRFSKMSGYFLEKHSDIVVNEEKIYGVQPKKVEKVLSAFKDFNRNLGVILSGDKGMGKSLFAKLLSVEAVKCGLPVIIIDEYIPGIPAFIETIEQEAVVLFDEFDKTFSENNDEGTSPQESLLSLFDGMSGGKKLFVATCNKLRDINDYLINRPGRFHYHFRFEYPSPEEVREYLTDKLKSEYADCIDSVVSFSKKVDLNYDCLRAIAFEINRGESFASAIKDLNIVNVNNEVYELKMYYENGAVVRSGTVCMNLFDSYKEHCIYMNDNKGRNVVDITFLNGDAVFDPELMTNIVQGENIEATYCSGENEEAEKFIEVLKNSKILYAEICRKPKKDIHYDL